MRNAGALVLVGLVILGGIAAYLLWQPTPASFRGLLSTPGVALPRFPAKGTSKDEAKEEAKSAKLTTKPKARKDKSVNGEDLKPIAEAAQADLVAASPPAASHPFPNARDIKIGLDRAKLVGAFGRPSMKTTSVERDRLMETFVYLQSDPNSATFVLLQNAKVVSAHTSVF